MWHDFRFLLLLDNFQYNFRYLVVIINNFYRSIDKSHNFVQKYICKSRVSSSFITSILSPFSMSSWEILINSNSSSEWVIKTLNTSIYSRWNRISDFSHFLVFWPLFGLKHLVWGSQFVTSKVTMPKITFRRKLHWKMPCFWAFYLSKLRRKIIHFFIEFISYFS